VEKPDLNFLGKRRVNWRMAARATCSWCRWKSPNSAEYGEATSRRV